MFLLSSAASLHGHEFSPVDRNPAPRRRPLPRSAFSTPLQRRNTATEHSLSQLSIRRPARPVSAHAHRQSEPVVHFEEPEPDAMSEDARSVANSEASEITESGKRRHRRSIRTRTSFHLAQPAPTLTRVLHIRPKLLLQLQRLSADSRPRPAIDVVPSTVVLPRLVKKFPRMFRGKGELGANDVMVFKSEDYNIPEGYNSEDTDLDEESLENRDLLAVICQLRKDSGGSPGMAEIVLNDGSVWIATPLPNNLYEFVTVDDRGNKTTARWVRRNAARKSMDLSEGMGKNNKTNIDSKLTFSIINPNSRRHPIMASLTQNNLDISDYYTSVPSSFAKHPPTSPLRLFPGDDEYSATEQGLTQERTLHDVDESLKVLIQVTGIWVTLREGISPYFKYNDTMGSTATCTNQKSSPGGRTRSVSISPDVPRPRFTTTASSTPESNPSNIGSAGSKFRRPCGRCSPTSGTSPQVFEKAGLPKRTVSTGAVFMQRATAARKSSGTVPSANTSDGGGEPIFHLPRRAATERLTTTTTTTSLFSMSSDTTTAPVSLASTPATPTKPQRRVQSAYVPSSTLQHSFSSTSTRKHSLDLMNETRPPDIAPKTRIGGRWKIFTNLFRRMNNHARAQ